VTQIHPYHMIDFKNLRISDADPIFSPHSGLLLDFGIQSLASCSNSLEVIACCKVHSGQCSHVQSFCVEIPCWLMFIVKLFPIWPKCIKDMLIVYLIWPSLCLFSKLPKFIYLSKICWFYPLVFIPCWLMLIVQLCFLCFLKKCYTPIGLNILHTLVIENISQISTT